MNYEQTEAQYYEKLEGLVDSIPTDYDKARLILAARGHECPHDLYEPKPSLTAAQIGAVVMELTA